MFLTLKKMIQKIMKIGRKNKKSLKTPDGYLKSGVRKLTSDDEVFEAFGLKDEPAISIDSEEKTLVYEKKDRPKAREKQKEKKMPFDKNGLPVLDHLVDYSILMEQGFEEGENLPDVLKDSIKEVTPVKKMLKTRHGIPILENDDAYSFMFNESGSDEDFNEILAESLGGKSKEVLLKEKKDKMGSGQKLTVRQRLSRYPLPQGQLDLHGYTAIKADLKAEAYLKDAFSNGTYTVRIIVGKGLHSEDGPVLPDVIENRIMIMKNEKIVYAYEWDKKKKSKSGAVTVFLNNYHT